MIKKTVLESETKNLNYSGFIKLRNEYCLLTKKHKFKEIPTSGEVIEMIKYFKRRDVSLPTITGIYKDLTPFEAANRIASDLVILNDLVQLFKQKLIGKNEIFSIHLGNENVKGKGDISFSNFECEAFNVAPTFLSEKMRKTIIKWKNNPKLKYILINEDAFSGQSNHKDKRVVKVKDWKNID